MDHVLAVLDASCPVHCRRFGLGVPLRLPLRINEMLGAGLVALPKGLAGIPPAIFGASVEGLQEAAQ